MHPIIVM